MQRRRAGGEPQNAIRLNLQWAAARGVPEGLSISGKGVSESAALIEAIEPGVIYVMDRGYISFKLLDRIIHAPSDFVLRLKTNNYFIPSENNDLSPKFRPLSQEDHEALILSDQMGHLAGPAARFPPPAGTTRLITLVNPDHPDEPIRLLTNLIDVPAHVVAALYRWRWKIELFFRWLKVHAHFRHLTSHSKNGVTIGFYIAVIGVLLIYLHTQRPVSKYAYAMLSLVAAGSATLADITPILERRERECQLARARLERKKAEKKSK